MSVNYRHAEHHPVIDSDRYPAKFETAIKMIDGSTFYCSGFENIFRYINGDGGNSRMAAGTFDPTIHTVYETELKKDRIVAIIDLTRGEDL